MKTSTRIALLLCLLGVLLLLSNFVTCQTTVICTPSFNANWTGYCTSSNKYNGPIRAGEDVVYPLTYVYNGWAVFNVSNIPTNAIIVNIVFAGQTTTAGGSNHILFLKKMTVDPVSATASVIFSDIYSSGTHYGGDETIMQTTGSHSIALNDNAITDLQSKRTSGITWWAIGFRNQGDNDAYGEMSGWQLYQPQIHVTYVLSPPVTVTLTPNNTTNWTGYCTTSSKNGPEIRAGQQALTSTVYNGWAVFNTSSIPSIATILNVKFKGNTITQGGSEHILYIKKMLVDPITATASAIFNDIYNSTVHYANDEIIMQSTGVHTVTLENSAISALQTQVNASSGKWALGFRNQGDNDNYGAFQGYTNGQPQIVVTYACDVPEAASITGNSSVCQGSNINLSISSTGATGFNWTVPAGWTIVSGQNTSSISVTAGSNSGNVSVVRSNACGNAAPSVKTITVHPLPNVTLTASPSSVCMGNSTQLVASGASTYSWSAGLGSGSTKTVTPSATTTYYVTGTSSNGCTDTEQITITVNPLPVVVVTANTMAVCPGQPVTLTASGASTYAWSNGLGNSNPLTTAPTSTTTYVVTGTNTFGCSAVQQITITVYPLPNVTLTPFANVCVNYPPFNLSNGSPSGGIYSGPGIVTSPLFDPALADTGNKTIVYTYTDPVTGCTNAIAGILYVGPCLGVNDNEIAPPYLIYPNPSSGTIIIQCSADVIGTINIRLYNVLGSQVLDRNAFVTSTEKTISLSLIELPTGLYLLSIYDKKKPYSSSIMIK